MRTTNRGPALGSVDVLVSFLAEVPRPIVMTKDPFFDGRTRRIQRIENRVSGIPGPARIDALLESISCP